MVTAAAAEAASGDVVAVPQSADGAEHANGVAAPAEATKPAEAAKPAEPAAAAPPTDAAAPVRDAPAEPAVEQGREVEIIGTQMSGSVGVVEEFLDQKDRWKVRFPSGIAKNFKRDNLKVIRQSERRKATDKHGQSETDAGEAASRQDWSRKKIHSWSRAFDQNSRSGSLSEAIAQIKRQDDKAFMAAEEVVPQAANRGASAGGEAVVTPASVAVASSAPRDVVAAQVAPLSGAGVPPAAVNLAGRSFTSREELTAYVKAVQKRMEEGAQSDGRGMLEGADRFLFFHLMMQHQAMAEKMRAPVRAIRYGVHHKFPKSKCFMLVFADGSEEPVSWTKCIKELFSNDGPTSAQVGKRVSDAAAGSRTAKRPRRAEEPIGEESRTKEGLGLIKDETASQK